MANTLQQLTQDALELPVAERAKLAHALITSIDEGTDDANISSDWDAAKEIISWEEKNPDAPIRLSRY